MKLLVLLLGMLILAPLLEQFFHLLVLEDLFLTAVFAYAAYSISRNRALLAAAICLAVPAIASTWLKPLVKAQGFAIFAGLCDVAFIATVTVAILAYIFRQKDISADVIAGAIVAYLLMAVMWSQMYLVLETAQPGSFNIPSESGDFLQALLRYFSLVTITTVGYGKTPLSTYLAHQGWKVANVPIHSDMETPQDLFKIDQRKVFALIINVENLVKLREGRLKQLGLEPDAKYADPVKVADEIEWCKDFIRKNPRWRIVDVSNRAIEEVAASIMNSDKTVGKNLHKV